MASRRTSWTLRDASSFVKAPEQWADTCHVNDRRKQHSVRRIVLPSGRTIEVVQFGEPAVASPALHVCPACGSDLVQPVAWAEAPGNRWELTLECPNCWWATEGLFEREAIQELEERLDDGLAQLLDDLKRLSRANMVDQIERFVSALEAGHILPEDF